MRGNVPVGADDGEACRMLGEPFAHVALEVLDDLRSRASRTVWPASREDEVLIKADDTPVRYPFRTAAELFGHGQATGLAVSGVMLANELS